MIKMIKNMALDVLPDVWPVLIIITVIACSLRICYLVKNKQKFILHKELVSLIFILYILCLFEVVTFQDVNFGTSNFIPFKEIFRYDVGSRLFVKNIVGNILLFLPYGYFVSHYLDNKKASLILFLTLIVSSTIELVQLKIGRTFDIDDIILNIVGGLIGYLIYLVIDGIRDRLPQVFRNDAFVNFAVISIIILVIMYSFNLNAFTWFGLLIN